jgi:Fur family zinc uptake transcriptional regulator
MRSDSEVKEILKQAEAYCLKNGFRLTEGRAAVLEQAARSRKPAKAYEILEAISADGARLMPPLVYRALDFWMSHGFIHRIEGLNAYTVCTHPGCGHECQIFICTQCGRVSEICDEGLQGRVLCRAEALGFRIEQLRVEAAGRCPDCRDGASAAKIRSTQEGDPVTFFADPAVRQTAGNGVERMNDMRTEFPDLVEKTVSFLDAKKAENIVMIDLREVANIADYFIVATAANGPHLKALGDGLKRLFKNEQYEGFRSAGTGDSGWVIVDCDGVMIHVFSEEMRSLYDLEKLWKDAKRVELKNKK